MPPELPEKGFPEKALNNRYLHRRLLSSSLSVLITRRPPMHTARKICAVTALSLTVSKYPALLLMAR